MPTRIHTARRCGRGPRGAAAAGAPTGGVAQPCGEAIGGGIPPGIWRDGMSPGAASPGAPGCGGGSFDASGYGGGSFDRYGGGSPEGYGGGSPAGYGESSLGGYSGASTDG